MVEVERYPRQIAKVFKKGEEREEDGHGWEHDGHNPGQPSIKAKHQYPMQPAGAPASATIRSVDSGRE
jgi:hypothetical protein